MVQYLFSIQNHLRKADLMHISSTLWKSLHPKVQVSASKSKNHKKKSLGFTGRRFVLAAALAQVVDVVKVAEQDEQADDVQVVDGPRPDQAAVRRVAGNLELRNVHVIYHCQDTLQECSL